VLGWHGVSGETVLFDSPLAKPRGEPLERWMREVQPPTETLWKPDKTLTLTLTRWSAGCARCSPLPKSSGNPTKP
jgi:hypothetical protein